MELGFRRADGVAVVHVAPEHRTPWIGSLVFGGIVLTTVGAFIIDPARGIWPSGNMLPRLAPNFIANAIWGWGASSSIRAFTAGRESD